MGEPGGIERGRVAVIVREPDVEGLPERHGRQQVADLVGALEDRLVRVDVAHRGDHEWEREHDRSNPAAGEHPP